MAEAFKEFWARTLAEISAQPLNPELKPLSLDLPGIRGQVLKYDGFAGSRLEAHYLLPENREGRIPAVLQFHGYMSCKSEPAAHLPLLNLGMAVLAVDVRGQLGRSRDREYPGGPGTGRVTQGILDPEGSYFQAMYADVVQGVNFLVSRPEVDAGRILANGDSQGGGLALAAACLDQRIALVAADNPSLMGFRLKLDLKAGGSTEEIQNYLSLHPGQSAEVFRTLDYFDLNHHLPSLHCPSLWSASADDPICPLESVEAGFNLVPGTRKKLNRYRGMGHEVHPDQLGLKLAWIREHFLAS